MLSLHHHSTFSTLDGYGLPEQIVAKAKELGREAVALTEHDNVFSHPYLQEACDKAGLKPIFGCEMRLVRDISRNSREKYHITVISRTQAGYTNLMKLVSKSYSREYFYYRPTIDIAALKEHSNGITILSGCPSSLMNGYILSGNIDKAIELAKEFKDIFGEYYYLEIMPHDMDETKIIAPAVKKISQIVGVPIVITNDEHYFERGQHKIQRILHAIRNRSDIWNVGSSIPSLYLMDDEQAFQHAKLHIGDFFSNEELLTLFNNQEKIAADCNVRIPKSGFVDYGSSNPFEELKERAYDGLSRIGEANTNVYLDRIEKELDLIYRKGFANYFLVVSDIVGWAKRSGILVGPSRGSSACSLVAFLMGITETNPIKHGLIMERFLSEDRNDLPDIDIDFEDRKRDLVIQYMHERFSRDNVAHLSTLVRFTGRNTLREIGKVFSIPPDDVSAVQNVLIMRGSADARASATIEDTFAEFNIARDVAERHPEIKWAIPLEWQIRHTGIHAAGLVVSSTPLMELTAVTQKEVINPDGTTSQANVCMLTGESVYTVGIPKVDILGLKNLSMLSDMCEESGIEHKDLYNIDLEDPESLEKFNNDTLGIFQFGSPSTASIARQFGVTSFFDVVLSTALSRPGPLHSQQSMMMTESKKKGERKMWDIPLMNDITKDTYGYVAFQEQVIRIMREVGGMDWADVSKVRNAMSKSLGDEFFNKYREMFIEGSAKKHNLSRDYANNIFDHTSHFGSWAFNLAHAVGYSIISLWTAWFKAHYPRMFYQVMCNYYIDDSEKMMAFLREYVEKGYGKVLPPKINKSKLKWTLEGDDLRAGLSTVIPEGAANIIIDLYPIADEDDLLSRIPDRRRVNSRVMGLIKEHHLFEESDDYDPFGLYAFAERMSRVVDRTHKIGELGYDFSMRQVTVAGVMDRQINEKSITELEQTVKLGDWHQRFDKSYGDKWCIFYLRDETGGVINVHLKNDRYPKYKDMLWSKKLGSDIIVARGWIPPGMSHMVAHEVWEWNDSKYSGAKCFKCSLIKSGFCKPNGSTKYGVMLLGIAPGRDEITNQRFFSGAAGKKLDQICERCGIHCKEDWAWISNVVLCRPTDEEGNNRDPSDFEISCCYSRLMDEVDTIKPKVIVAFGRIPYKALTGDDPKSIRDYVSIPIEMETANKHKYTLILSYHPASILYPSASEVRRERIRGIANSILAARKISESVRVYAEESHASIPVYNEEEIYAQPVGD